MLPLTVPFSLIVAHFIGDWLLQDDNTATRKGKSWWVLTYHCLIVNGSLAGWAWFVGMDIGTLRLFLVSNFLLHFLTDAITSQFAARWWFINLWQIQGKPTFHTHFARIKPTHGLFFKTIGFDQVLHYAAYAGTLAWLQ